MSDVTTTLVVDFSSDNDGKLTAEIDGRTDGLNGGKTSFAPGDSVGILVYASPNVTVDQVIPSAGTIASLAGGVSAEEETLQFGNTNSADLSKPVDSGFTYEWLGTSLGVPSVVGSTVQVPNTGVAVLKVAYNSRYKAYRLSGVPTAYEEAIVYIHGTVA